MSIVQFNSGKNSKACDANVRQLRTAQEKLSRLSEIVSAHFYFTPSDDFLARIMDVIHDNAFCEQFLAWYDLRVVKEINHYIDAFDYDSLDEWCEIAEYLPTPFLNKLDANTYLNDLKVQELKSMMLDASMKIHSIFYSIAANEVDGLVPYNLISKLSLEKLVELEPLINNIIQSQAEATLKENGYTSWKQWERAINGQSDSDDIKLHAV